MRNPARATVLRAIALPAATLGAVLLCSSWGKADTTNHPRHTGLIGLGDYRIFQHAGPRAEQVIACFFFDQVIDVAGIAASQYGTPVGPMCTQGR